MDFKLNEFIKYIDVHNFKSKSELARKMAISRSYLSEVLSGKKEPGIKFSKGFQKAFPDEHFDKFF